MFQQPNSIKTVLELKSHKQIEDSLKNQSSPQNTATSDVKNQSKYQQLPNFSSSQNFQQSQQLQQSQEDKLKKQNSNNFEDLMANNIQNPVSIVFQMKNLLKNVNEKISDLQEWKKKEKDEFEQKMKENEEKKQQIRDQLLAEFEDLNLDEKDDDFKVHNQKNNNNNDLLDYDNDDIFKYSEQIQKLKNKKDEEDDDFLLKQQDEKSKKVTESITITNQKLANLKNNYENIVLENQLLNEKNFKEYEKKLKDDLLLSNFNAQIQDWQDILEDITFKQQQTQNVSNKNIKEVAAEENMKINTNNIINNKNKQQKELVNIQKEIENENQEFEQKLKTDLDDIDKELEELEKLMNYK